jgi:hypothetical protein
VRHPAPGERVWRVRKHHVWIDAQLHAADDRTGVELQFFYDGQLLLASRWATREQALADASTRLRELQRAGWNTHW